jgi:23S rRNA pseudouridine1911/1915/1917 synthase
LIPVIYEDDQYIVFNKPSGLVVIPTPAKETKTLVSLVNSQYASEITYKLHPCHRLDRDTSGVIIFAKGKKAQQKMMALFESHKIRKVYRAFVNGKMAKKCGEFRKAVIDYDEKKFRPQSVPKEAVTKYKVIKQYDRFADVEVEILTGRTIRFAFISVRPDIL